MTTTDSTLESAPAPAFKPEAWYRRPGALTAMILGVFFVVVPSVNWMVTTYRTAQKAEAPVAVVVVPTPTQAVLEPTPMDCLGCLAPGDPLPQKGEPGWQPWMESDHWAPGGEGAESLENPRRFSQDTIDQTRENEKYLPGASN